MEFEFDLEDFIETHARQLFWYGIAFVAGFFSGFISGTYFQGLPFYPAMGNAIWYGITAIIFLVIGIEAGRHMRKR